MQRINSYATSCSDVGYRHGSLEPLDCLRPHRVTASIEVEADETTYSLPQDYVWALSLTHVSDEA